MSDKEDFQQLCQSGELAGAATPNEIEIAELALGVKFPDDYLDFLTSFGALVGQGIEIYGLPDQKTNDPPLWQNVVSVTTKLRDWKQAGTEQGELIAISDDGTGVYFFLDTSASPETKIWAIGPGVRKLVSTNFFGFFVSLSEGKASL